MRKLLIVILIILIVGLLRLSFFTVGPTEFVYLTRFGEHIATYDGADTVNDAGLHVGWPWPVMSVQRLDRRLQFFDLPVTELPTRDADSPVGDDESENRIDKMLIVEAYACWRIADKESVDLFIRTVGTAEKAQERLGQQINGQLWAAFSKMSTKDLISTDAEHVEAQVNQLYEKLLADLRDPLLKEYGIELVDVRLRRYYHSPEVTRDIFEAIKAKRKEKAEKYYSKGDEISNKIKKDADASAAKIETNAKNYAELKTKNADSEALEIRNEAHAKDKELFEYLKKMEVLKEVLKNNKTLLLLSTHRTFFEMMFQQPYPGAGVGAAPGSPTMNPKDKANGGQNGKKGGGD